MEKKKKLNVGIVTYSNMIMDFKEEREKKKI